jgi:lon-related putative ATP-dependent protease
VKERVRVDPDQLRRTWDPRLLGFASTEEIPELEGLVGQERAVEAMRFGLAIASPGYNIYVAGPSGTGKTSYTCSLVRSHAATRDVPDDWVYVHNFDRPDEPIALALPAGRGPAFAREMEQALGQARNAAGHVLASKEHHAQKEELVHDVRAEMAKLVSELDGVARQAGFALRQSEAGVMPVPIVNGQPATEEQFGELPPETRQQFTERSQAVQAAVVEAGRRSSELERSLQAELRELDAEAVELATAPALSHLHEHYREFPRITEWLTRVQEELAGHAVPDPAAAKVMEEAAAAAAQLQVLGLRRRRIDPNARFRVNAFVHHKRNSGAPVVVEVNPTYVNLFGKAEIMVTADGTAEDGVMQLKAGAIHRANGGYLILQAAEVLKSPFAWEALKRALVTGEARIEVPGQENRILPVEMVRPQSIPLNVKVILIGDSGIYHLLHTQDESFRKQFKLKAEFDIVMDASPANVRGYAAFISSVCRRHKVAHLTAAAVGKVIEHSHRLADDRDKLSARFNEIAEVVYEANAWAAQEGASLVDVTHVAKAIREKAARSALPQVRLQEMIRRGTVLVDVDGEIAGQVNGLTVMDLGDYRFGSPSRITARVYTGEKGILQIERETAMSGHIHDKGVLTLSAYLGDRFARDKPLAFSASIAFEQTYMPVDGDSASSTELYALLSALSGVPIRQGIAVTGSVNQRGQIQPIGGVNEKVEGFFQVCELIGLTGEQGVMIPARNLANLALSEAVVAAVRAGRFHLWAVNTIEEGIEILTGMPAGELGRDGSFPQGSLFERVDHRIHELAETMLAWNRGRSALTT